MRSMKQREWKSIVVILIVCLLVPVQLLLMRLILQRHADLLLSESGVIAAAEDASSAQSGTETVPDALRPEEWKQVIANMDSASPEILHDPTGLQISMKEAIAAGEGWFEKFAEAFGHSSFDGYTEVRAMLCRKESADAAGLPEGYGSYWIVSCQTEGMEADLYLHAVTAQMLKIEMVAYQPPEMLQQASKYGRMLQGFAEQIGWGSCQAVDETAAGATAYLPELELTAVLTVVDQSIYYDHSDAQYREIVHLSLQERRKLEEATYSISGSGTNAGN